MPKDKVTFFDIVHSCSSLKIKAVKLFDYVFGSLLSFFIIPQKTVDPASLAVRNMLIIRPGGMGDAVFLLPVLKAMRRSDPSLTIDILCETRNADVFALEGGLCRNVYRYDSWGDWKKFFRASYDVVVDTEQWHYLTGILACFLKTPCRVGFKTRPWRAKLFNHGIDYGAQTYEIFNFVRLFEGLSRSVAELRSIDGCLTVDAAHRSWAASQIPENSVALSLGASIEPRRLTLEQAKELVAYIAGRGSAVVLLGGADVMGCSEQIIRETGISGVFNYVGKCDLGQSVALINRSKLFIGPDSGLMHLSAAAGTPTIGIFGPGNFRKWSLQGDRHRSVSEHLFCSPCTRYGYTVPTCHGKFDCMRKINLQKVFAQIDGFLKA